MFFIPDDEEDVVLRLPLGAGTELALSIADMLLILVNAIGLPYVPAGDKEKARKVLDHLAGVAEHRGHKNAGKVLLRGLLDEFAMAKAAEIGKSLTMDDYNRALTTVIHGDAAGSASGEGGQQMAADRQGGRTTIFMSDDTGAAVRLTQEPDGVRMWIKQPDGVEIDLPPADVILMMVNYLRAPWAPQEDKDHAGKSLAFLADIAEKRGHKDVRQALLRGKLDDFARRKAAEISASFTVGELVDALKLGLPRRH